MTAPLRWRARGASAGGAPRHRRATRVHPYKAQGLRRDPGPMVFCFHRRGREGPQRVRRTGALVDEAGARKFEIRRGLGGGTCKAISPPASTSPSGRGSALTPLDRTTSPRMVPVQLFDGRGWRWTAAPHGAITLNLVPRRAPAPGRHWSALKPRAAPACDPACGARINWIDPILATCRLNENGGGALWVFSAPRGRSRTKGSPPPPPGGRTRRLLLDNMGFIWCWRGLRSCNSGNACLQAHRRDLRAKPGHGLVPSTGVVLCRCSWPN